MIPYVIAGTCSTEHKRGIDFLLLISFLPAMLFMTWETITSEGTETSFSKNMWCISAEFFLFYQVLLQVLTL
jgi:hypothetical protein